MGLYFSSLHWLKHTFNLEEPLTALQAISLGITARSMSGALLIPITVVKTRFEVHSENNNNNNNNKIIKYRIKSMKEHDGIFKITKERNAENMIEKERKILKLRKVFPKRY